MIRPRILCAGKVGDKISSYVALDGTPGKTLQSADRRFILLRDIVDPVYSKGPRVGDRLPVAC